MCVAFDVPAEPIRGDLLGSIPYFDEDIRKPMRGRLYRCTIVFEHPWAIDDRVEVFACGEFCFIEVLVDSNDHPIVSRILALVLDGDI
jgi:hypothetical protein